MIDPSSLIYNPSVRHEQHECDTSDTNATRVTQVKHERHDRDTSAKWVLHERRKCYTSATRTTQVRHEWKVLIFITTPVKPYFHTSIFTI